MDTQLKYFSMFTGIEGFGYGIEQAFSDQQDATLREGKGRKGNVDQDGRGNVHSGSFTPLCVGYSEIDQYAIGITTYNYPKHKNYGNARRIIPEQLPDFDLLIGGFPCQSFSIAGKRGGLEDIRGTLFFEIARILRTKRPKTFILENVRGLFSAGITDEEGNLIKGTSGFVFKIIIATLRDLGYDIEWQCINSKDHGVPQNRERVFIIGHLAGSGTRKIFPFPNSDQKIIQEGNERIVSGTISTKNQSGQVQFDGSTTLIIPKELNPKLSYPITRSYQKGQYEKSRGTVVTTSQAVEIIDRKGNKKNKNIASTERHLPELEQYERNKLQHQRFSFKYHTHKKIDSNRM
jgi:DNA (cytosine-5)-methyltransferase 1